MKWHNPIPFLKALWHRPAGPMNWKNPIRGLAVVGWLVFRGLGLHLPRRHLRVPL